MEITGCDEEKGTFSFVLVPNRERYELREIDGKKLWYDRLDNLYLPENILQETAEFMLKTQPNIEPPLIGDSGSYVVGRRSEIRSSLTGISLANDASRDTSKEYLDKLIAADNEFVIMSVDLVGSTSMAVTQSTEHYVATVQTFLNELADLVPLFRGHILKFTGDGAIAYFPAPSFITKNDLAMDCACSILRLVQDGINPELKALGRAEIAVRIGMDSGSASVVTLGSVASTQQRDIIGPLVSLACKIQAKTPVGGIGVGEYTLRNLHTNWRKRFDEVRPKELDYTNPDTGSKYLIYTMPKL